MATTQQFYTRFPEFETIDEDRVQMFMDDAALLMSEPSRWLDFYDIAHQYHSAHLLVAAESSEMGDVSGLQPVSEREVDDVRVKYAVSDIPVNSEDIYSSTYGRRYASYRDIVFTGPIGV